MEKAHILNWSSLGVAVFTAYSAPSIVTGAPTCFMAQSWKTNQLAGGEEAFFCGGLPTGPKMGPGFLLRACGKVTQSETSSFRERHIRALTIRAVSCVLASAF